MKSIKILFATILFAFMLVGCGSSASDIEAKANEFAIRSYEAICDGDSAAEIKVDREMDDYLNTLNEEQQSLFISVYSDKMIEFMDEEMEAIGL